jgi:hypothetical protein
MHTTRGSKVAVVVETMRQMGVDGRLRLRNELVRLQQSDEQVEQLGLKRLGFGEQTMPYESRVVERTVDEFEARVTKLEEARLARAEELQGTESAASRRRDGSVQGNDRGGAGGGEVEGVQEDEEQEEEEEEDDEKTLMNEFMRAVNDQHLERESWRRLTHTALCETFPQHQAEIKCLGLSPTVDKSCQSGESISFPGVVTDYYHYTFSVDVEGLPIHPAQTHDGTVEEIQELLPEVASGGGGEQQLVRAEDVAIGDDGMPRYQQAAAVQVAEVAPGAAAEAGAALAGSLKADLNNLGQGAGSATSILFARDGYFCTYKNIGGTATNPKWTKCVWQWYEELHAKTVLNKSKQASGTPFFVKTESAGDLMKRTGDTDDSPAGGEVAISVEYTCNLPFELWTAEEASLGLEEQRRSGVSSLGLGQLPPLTAETVKKRLTHMFHFEAAEAEAILEAALGGKKSGRALSALASFRKQKGKDGHKDRHKGRSGSHGESAYSNDPLEPAQLRALELAVQEMRVKVMWKGGKDPAEVEAARKGSSSNVKRKVWGGVPLLEELYPRECRVLAKQVSGGFSGACVFEVRSFNAEGAVEVPSIVKFDALDRIVNELSGLQTMAPLLGDNYPKIMPNGIAPAGQKLEERGYSRRDMFVTGSYNEEAKRSKKKVASTEAGTEKRGPALSAVGEEGEEGEEGVGEEKAEQGNRAASVPSAKESDTEERMAAIKMQYVGSAFMLPELIAGGGDNTAAALLTTFTDVFKQHIRLGAMAMQGRGNNSSLYSSSKQNAAVGQQSTKREQFKRKSSSSRAVKFMKDRKERRQEMRGKDKKGRGGGIDDGPAPEATGGDDGVAMVLVAVPTQVLTDVLEVMHRPTVEMAVKKPMNLFKEFSIQRYLDRFVFKRAARMEKDYSTGKRAQAENNPTTVDEIEQGAEKWIREFWSAMRGKAERLQGDHWWGLTHGDLNGNNFMVDTGGIVSLIDFAGSGRGHVLKDLAKLETAILLEYTHLEDDDMPLAKKVVEALYDVQDLQDEAFNLSECDGLDNHSTLQPMIDCLRVLRQFASRYCKDDPSFLAYSIALFGQAIKCTGYVDTSLLHKQLALFAAKQHANRIESAVQGLSNHPENRLVKESLVSTMDLTMSDGAIGMDGIIKTHNLFLNSSPSLDEGMLLKRGMVKRASAPAEKSSKRLMMQKQPSKAMLQRQASRLRGPNGQKSSRTLVTKTDSVSEHSAAMAAMAKDHELRKYCVHILITEGTIIDAISRELVPVERCATMRFIAGKTLDEIDDTEHAEGIPANGGSGIGVEKTPEELLLMAQKHDMILILGDAAAGKSISCIMYCVNRLTALTGRQVYVHA